MIVAVPVDCTHILPR